MDLNKLTLNEIKSKVICINPKSRNCQSFPIETFDFGAIPFIDNIKYLGIEIDSKLNFKSHISKVQSKISKGVGILYKLNKLLPTRTFFSTKSLPFIFTDYFMYLKDCHHHKTRISDLTNFFLPYCSSSRLQRCIKYSGVILWNCIPKNIKKLAHKNFKVLTDHYK